MAAPVEEEIFGVRVESTPLPFDRAQPLIPTIGEILSIASRDLAALAASGKLDPRKDVMDPRVLAALLPAMGQLMAYLDGKLERLSERLLVGTRVALPDAKGELGWLDLCKPKDRSYAFDQRPDLFLPTLLHAGRVTFGRFFPARARSETEALGRGT